MRFSKHGPIAAGLESDWRLSRTLLVSLAFNEMPEHVQQELSGDTTIRLSTLVESERIEAQFDRIFSSNLLLGSLPIFGEWAANRFPGQVHWTPHTKPRSFIVVEVSEANRLRTELLVEIAPCPLRIGIAVGLGEWDSTAWSPNKLFALDERLSDGRELHQSRVLTNQNIQELANIFETSNDQQFGSEHEFHHFLDQYSQTQALEHGSPFKFVAIVSLIEGVLTHAPDQNDPTSSVGRQVRGKVALLLARDKCAPLQNEYFPNFPIDDDYVKGVGTLWKQLYALRSQIAHGKKADFSDQKMQRLVSIVRCTNYVEAVVCSLLRTLLAEPELVFALRAV